jgi:acyl-CoA synthetase (NDP forming)
MVGLGGVLSDLTADRAFCLTPLSREDAEEHIRSLRGAPLLFGYRGSPRREVDGLTDMLLRVARLAEDVPEIAELDINPVVVGTDSAVAVDVKVRLAPFRGGHPLRRQLAGGAG